MLWKPGVLNDLVVGLSFPESWGVGDVYSVLEETHREFSHLFPVSNRSLVFWGVVEVLDLGRAFELGQNHGHWGSISLQPEFPNSISIG